MPRCAVPEDDVAVGDVDDADYLVLFLGGHDLGAVRGEEDVVRTHEGLAGREVPGSGEHPQRPTLRIDEHESVVVFVRDQDWSGKYMRVRAGRQESSGERVEPSQRAG